ncbi:host-nuclease inhibitor Gam family protein, partial [Desulfofalx alkaliphila]|uniref:host-nuclease inhibitor Gam family protein n=1 Tax=Desulfofalx alkaliphila TaxID=105483 RepID=UPI0004E18AFA
PYGTLKMRAQQPQYQRDDAAIKEWARVNRPEVLVQQEPKLDWAALKKVLQVAGDKLVDPETGETVPGVVVVERQPKFSVEV